MILLCGVLLAGCRGSEDATQTTAASPPADESELPLNVAVAAAPDADLRTAERSTSGVHRRDEIWTDADGNKYLGRIPYDVFAVHPSEIAANTTPVVGAALSEAPVIASTDSSPVTIDSPVQPVLAEVASAATADGSWDALISRDVLEAEVKEIRNFLTPTLQSFGNYRSKMTMIPANAATLAVLSLVAERQTDKVSWHKDAKYLGDLARLMNQAPLQKTPKDQRRLQDLLASVTDILNRSRPAGLPEPSEGQTFSDVADIGLVMKRMQAAETKLKTEIGTEANFAAQSEMIRQESQLLRVLAKVITTEGYGYADDPDFKALAQPIIGAGARIEAAMQTMNFSDYELALTAISTACTACHTGYRNN